MSLDLHDGCGSAGPNDCARDDQLGFDTLSEEGWPVDYNVNFSSGQERPISYEGQFSAAYSNSASQTPFHRRTTHQNDIMKI